jgi:RNA polymerase sigma factor (sigma-70 family)
MSNLSESTSPETLFGPDLEAAIKQGGASWRELVERVRSGDPAGVVDLYRLFSTGIRFYLCRHVGPQDLDDKVHDLFMIVVQSIQTGDLREPDRLMGYVRTIVRRQVAARIDNIVQARRNQTDLNHGMALSEHQPNQERRLSDEEKRTLAMRILNSLHKREREVLMRVYLMEEMPEQICREMGLTDAEFRLIKSRAKARFGELGRSRFREGGHSRPRSEVATLAEHDSAEKSGDRRATPDIGPIVPVIAHAVAVFGDEHKASHWLATPLPLLDNRSPSQLLEAEGGINLVEQILTRIEHNIPS